MRKVREVLRLHFAAELSIRAIARSLGSSPSTVGGYLRRAKLAGLSWPLPASLDEAGLERRLFPAPPSPRAPRPLPDWSRLHRELRRKGVTLSLLWEEYKAVVNADGSGTAQRRPGREPRRHIQGVAASARADRPALNEGRGANPGDTRQGRAEGLRPWPSLNEGRGANPGDTPLVGSE